MNKPTLWFWPNVDAGADGTSTGIRAFREKYDLPNVHFFKNMEGKDFLHLLKNADALIGNSSVGIRECAFLGVPVVNIGTRQNQRERGNNVIDVTYEENAIKTAILQCIENPRPQPSDVYGGGNAGEQIADLLATLPLQFHKTITY
jgi:UDP-N-acetylglucosamine 2-epimerase